MQKSFIYTISDFEFKNEFRNFFREFAHWRDNKQGCHFFQKRITFLYYIKELQIKKNEGRF